MAQTQVPADVLVNQTEIHTVKAIEELVAEISLATGNGDPTNARVKGYKMSPTLDAAFRGIVDNFREGAFAGTLEGIQVFRDALAVDERRTLLKADSDVFSEPFAKLRGAIDPDLMAWLDGERRAFAEAVTAAVSGGDQTSLMLAAEKRLGLEKSIETAMAEQTNRHANVRPPKQFPIVDETNGRGRAANEFLRRVDAMLS